MMRQHPTDAQFPHISFALDVSLMRETLQRTLFTPTGNPGNCLVIEACQIDEQRYKPGSSYVLSYRLQLRHTETGAVQEQIVCARLCKTGKGLTELDRARSKNLVASKGMHPLIYLPEAEMLVWVFPNDRKLTHLPRMFDLPFLYDLLPHRLVALDLRRPQQLRKIEAEVMHYIPERSCMIRYKLEREHRGSATENPVRIYGKIYRDKSGGDVYSIMNQLSGQSETLVTAQPVGYDPEHKVLWQAELPGKPLVWEEIKAPHGLKIIEQIAVGVAAFHAGTVRSKYKFKLEDISLLLRETSDILEQTHPHLTNRVQPLIHSLLSQSGERGFFHTPLTPIHRDLKIGNFLIDDGKVGLVDMDCVCVGDPLSDIGSFIANFYYKGILLGCDKSRIRAIVEVFCRVYAEQVVWPVDQQRLNWYIAASFIYEIIRRSIRQWSTERMKHMNQYLDLSEHYCYQQ